MSETVKVTNQSILTIEHQYGNLED